MIEKLRTIIPDSVIAELPSVMDKFEINTSKRLAHFLAQCSHESLGFKVTQENLNYSAQGLFLTFHKYFKSKEFAKAYERNPSKIANYVYANRMGNGNEASGDGYRFRGRGYIQITGRYNYTELGEFLNEDLIINPDLVASRFPLLSAAWFWAGKELNEIADTGNISLITKMINGGYNGIEDREALTKKFTNYLT